LKGLAVLVLDDVRITQVHPKGIAHPTKAFLDVIEQFSRLIEKDASPDSQQVGGISLLLLFGSSQTQIWLILNKMTKLKKRT
jgi:hypothetical protein